MRVLIKSTGVTKTMATQPLTPFSSRTVSFAKEVTTQGYSCEDKLEEELGDDEGDFVESSSSEGERELSSDDENDAEVVQQIISSIYSTPPSMLTKSRVPPVERDSLLLLDKDLIEYENGRDVDRTTVLSVLQLMVYRVHIVLTVNFVITIS